MLYLYNTLARVKQPFQPINAPHVGLYVCGPTVYGDAHLGHARPAITFDILYRYLTHLGYKVRYVRNITDVGHLEHDADEGEDKIAKKARLEQLEPMEVVQYYCNRYHRDMEALNVLPPSIEPHASGHIIEQIEFVKKILDNGYAYVSEGSVYFDVEKYAKDFHYGKLSGRNLEDIVTETRELDGQAEKKHSYDFALWKKAAPEHIMHWPSPWSEGFPGWHMECSTMGTKYLGEEFDIHGGGMDLMFPHHEAEIAQSCAALGHDSVRYWMHNNMITIAGKKMGKSYNNFITLEQFFKGEHPLLSKPFGPMVIRFFILQAHYRSTVDFSSEALEAAEKGLQRINEAYARLLKLKASTETSANIVETIAGLATRCEEAMSDDLQSSTVISALFDSAKAINTVADGKGTISETDLAELLATWKTFAIEILGLRLDADDNAAAGNQNMDAYKGAVDLLLNMRLEAKRNKDWATSDLIRNQLTELGFTIKDGKDSFEWSL
ncbi:MAG: cysteine--tRNA ligase [Paludibacteraceae bacterium]|nr:cysteine--tRNA ligase [Paludibacteraceae bacterium]